MPVRTVGGRLDLSQAQRIIKSLAAKRLEASKKPTANCYVSPAVPRSEITGLFDEGRELSSVAVLKESAPALPPVDLKDVFETAGPTVTVINPYEATLHFQISGLIPGVTLNCFPFDIDGLRMIPNTPDLSLHESGRISGEWIFAALRWSNPTYSSVLPGRVWLRGRWRGGNKIFSGVFRMGSLFDFVQREIEKHSCLTHIEYVAVRQLFERRYSGYGDSLLRREMDEEAAIGVSNSNMRFIRRAVLRSATDVRRLADTADLPELLSALFCSCLSHQLAGAIGLLRRADDTAAAKQLIETRCREAAVV